MNKKEINKIIKSDKYVTMTTREIAEMTGKRHDNVLRDTREMIEKAGPALSLEWSSDEIEYIETTYKGKGRGARVSPMIVLGESMVMTLLAGYSTELRYRLVKELLARREMMEKAATRASLAAGYAPLTYALQQTRLEQGKEEKSHVYSNEANMINRIVLGMTAKQFRESRGVENVRDNLTTEEKSLMTKIQKMDSTLVELGHDYQERKQTLKAYKAKIDLRAAARAINSKPA